MARKRGRPSNFRETCVYVTTLKTSAGLKLRIEDPDPDEPGQQGKLFVMVDDKNFWVTNKEAEVLALALKVHACRSDGE